MWWGQKSVPSEWKVTGLEVTMRQYPEPRPRSPSGRDSEGAAIVGSCSYAI
jgi:hypothetical protein